MAESLHKSIGQTILAMEDGTVFSIADFEQIAKPKTVSKILSRLLPEMPIRKLFPGVFCKYSEKSPSPTPDEVARAIARSNRWLLAPCGQTVLYLVGIRDSEPAVWTYETSGTYREYTYDGKIISFRHSCGKALRDLYEKNILLVQSIRAIGKRDLSAATRAYLCELVGVDDPKMLLEQAKRTISWVGDVMRDICKDIRAEKSIKQKDNA